MKSIIVSIISVFLLMFFATASAGKPDSGGDPTKLGPYQIGHTTLLFTDPARNWDGSTPVSDPQGRPLYVHIWYPASSSSSIPTVYSSNNPIYDGVVFPQISANDYLDSDNGTTEQAPIVNDIFPLIVYSHDQYTSGGKMTAPLMETLASHGYIVAGVEHTGHSSIRYIGDFAGPSMSGGATRIIRRVLDIQFIITQLLDPMSDPNFSNNIDSSKIGMLGDGYGGYTTMMTIAGSASLGVLPDLRIKAATLMMNANSPFLQITHEDLAAVNIPVMLYGDDNDRNRSLFTLLTNSQNKYLVHIAGTIYASGAQQKVCETLHNALLDYQSNNMDPFALSTVDWAAWVSDYNYFFVCNASLFDGINDSTITNVADNGYYFGASADVVNAMISSMPLRKAVLPDELFRLAKWYVVSFFNKELKQLSGYDKYLEDSKTNRKQNGLVEFSKNCRIEEGQAMNLAIGDKITFTPSGKSYKISVSHNQALLVDKGNNLYLGDDATRTINLPFSFGMPEIPFIDVIKVNSNGVVFVSNLPNSGTQGSNYSGLAPWVALGEFLLNGQPGIAALHQDLDPTAGGGVYAKVQSNRVIITWDTVPVYTSEGNGDTSTMQIVINKSGIIEMTFGKMALTGPEYQPGYLGVIGITNGKTTASELRSSVVDFAHIYKPINKTNAAQVFYTPISTDNCN